MISFDINVADEVGVEAAKLFLDSLQLISNQVSLGDVKTLASAPGLSTQHQVPAEEQILIGIKPSTVRLSIGMEHLHDICEDIDQALEKVVQKFASSVLPPVIPEAMPKIEMALTNLSVAKSSDVTAAVAAAPSEETFSAKEEENNHALVQTQRTARLKCLYDQMNLITAEMETLQHQIKTANEAMLQEQIQFRE
jgi:hypothetical protein